MNENHEGKPGKDYTVDISHILQRTVDPQELGIRIMAGEVHIIASHHIVCRGHDRSLSPEDPAHAIMDVYSDSTRVLSCPYLSGKGNLELTHCGDEARWNSCIYLGHDNTAIR